MILMMQRKRKGLSDMRERLYRMRMEIQELEETLEECDNNSHSYSDDYEDRAYPNYQSRERGYRGRY